MSRLATRCAAFVFALSTLFGCTNLQVLSQMTGWEVLLDGATGLEKWTPIGDANWRMVNGALQADKGTGFLISKSSYDNFTLRAEFWSDEDVNSGIFIRLSNPAQVTAANSYEVNIYDKRPGQEYSTGAIVDVAKVALPAPKAAGKWNVFEVTARGSQLTVLLNGFKTVDVANTKHARGPIALQYAPGVVKDAGVIRFRKVEVRPL